MGGTGSGRQPTYMEKTTVEASLSLPTTPIRAALSKVADGKIVMESGSLLWSSSRGVTSRIGYHVTRDDTKIQGNCSPVVRLTYTTTYGSGRKVDSDYSARVVSTELHGGGRRWWWACPLCGRRAGKLYLPPGASYFGCRQCHDLTYTSCQESHKYGGMWASLARSMSDEYPGVIGRDMERLMSSRWRS